MENEEKKVKKGGKGSAVVIVLLIIIILGLCGYICYDKGVLEKIGLIKKPTESSDKLKDTKDKKVSVDEAKELIDTYYVEQLWDNIFTAEDGYDGMTKDIAAVRNVANSKKMLDSCYNIYENNPNAKKITNDSYTVSLNSSEFNMKFNSGACTTQKGAEYYKYSDLNSVYKNLFGKENDMPKSDFSRYGYVYDYIEDRDIFVSLSCECGGAEGPTYRKYFVKDVKVSGDNLTVNVGYVSMKANNDDFDDPTVSATIGGEEVSYKYSETQKDTFDKEFTDKYLDKLDSYEFKFKYEDSHYVFVKMTKK